MRVPECELLALVRRIERVVDIEDGAMRRAHARGQLIDEGDRQARRIGSRWCVLEPADG